MGLFEDLDTMLLAYGMLIIFKSLRSKQCNSEMTRIKFKLMFLMQIASYHASNAAMVSLKMSLFYA